MEVTPFCLQVVLLRDLRAQRLVARGPFRKPSPDLKPSLPSVDQAFPDRATGRAALSMAGSTVLWIASVRSVPTRSAFSSGPSTASRRPNARLDHGVDGLGIADAVLDQRHRLAPQRMLQAVADEARHVLLDVRRRLAAASCSAIVEVDGRAARSIAVPITSTSGTRNGGFHQWVPSARSRCFRLLHDVGDRDDGGVAGEDRVAAARAVRSRRTASA